MDMIKIILLGIALLGILIMLFPFQTQLPHNKTSNLAEKQFVSALNKSGVMVREGHIYLYFNTYARVDKEAFMYVAKKTGLVIKQKKGVFVTSWQGIIYKYVVEE